MSDFIEAFGTSNLLEDDDAAHQIDVDRCELEQLRALVKSMRQSYTTLAANLSKVKFTAKRNLDKYENERNSWAVDLLAAERRAQSAELNAKLAERRAQSAELNAKLVAEGAKETEAQLKEKVTQLQGALAEKAQLQGALAEKEETVAVLVDIIERGKMKQEDTVGE